MAIGVELLLFVSGGAHTKVGGKEYYYCINPNKEFENANNE
jgi:hypothetical protein